MKLRHIENSQLDGSGRRTWYGSGEDSAEGRASLPAVLRHVIPGSFTLPNKLETAFVSTNAAASH